MLRLIFAFPAVLAAVALSLVGVILMIAAGGLFLAAMAVIWAAKRVRHHGTGHAYPLVPAPPTGRQDAPTGEA